MEYVVTLRVRTDEAEFFGARPGTPGEWDWADILEMPAESVRVLDVQEAARLARAEHATKHTIQDDAPGYPYFV